jgi:serine/threonine-protein kinase RsbW
MYTRPRIRPGRASLPRLATSRAQQQSGLTIAQRAGKLPHSLLCRFLSAFLWFLLQRWTHGAVNSVEFKIDFVTMTEQRVSYTLESTLETVNSAEETATKLANEAGFDDEEVMKIAMAVREAAVNAVLHGNAYDPGKKVTVAFERTPKELVITIRDQGKGLDPSKIPDPLAPENLLKTSGRGIFLIRSFMDAVEINPSQTGTEIKLIKHVHGPAAGGKEASQ